jgi:hypothetical protein
MLIACEFAGDALRAIAMPASAAYERIGDLVWLLSEPLTPTYLALEIPLIPANL